MKKLSLTENLFMLLCDKKNRVWRPSQGSYERQKYLWGDFWDRMGPPAPDFKGKVIVDYGCGWGYESAFMLQGGASYIYCLDVSGHFLDSARCLHRSWGYDENVAYIINNDIDILADKIGRNKADLIVCKNVIEHVVSPRAVIDSMYAVLKPGGIACIGTSPFYYSPQGGHIHHKCRVPWVHLLFSEKTIVNVFKELYEFDTDVTNFADMNAGLNKLSYYDFLNMIDVSQWEKITSYENRIPQHRMLSMVVNLLKTLSPCKRIKVLFLISFYIRLMKRA